MESKAEHTAIQNSLVGKDVFYICHTAHESPDNFDAELCALRRSFFTQGQKACRTKAQGEYMGCASMVNGTIHRRSLKWKKNVGRVRLEEAFYIGKAFVVVRRDLNGTICGKIHYDRELRWTKTEYFTPEDYHSAKVILKPRESSDGVELFTYNPKTKGYDSQILYPVPYMPGDASQSLLNARYGEPILLVATGEGVFTYCGKDEQKRRLKDLDALKDGSLPAAPSWEEGAELLPEAEETEAPEGVAFQSLFEAGVPEASTAAEKEPEEAPLPEEALLLEEDLTLEVEAAPAEEAPVQKETLGEHEEEGEPGGVKAFSEETLTVGLVEEGERFNYTGRLMSGKRQGRGRTDRTNGLTVFDGSYQDGLRSGFGAAYSPEGALRYAGFWKGDKKDCGGVSFRESDQAMHVCSWAEGKPGPWTALFDAQGSLRFYGRILAGDKIGAGVALRGDCVFVGKYRGDGEPAEGALFDQDGNLLYSGGWKNGKRHGQGIEFDLSGQVVYAGQWRQDQYLNGVLYKKIDEE